MHSASWLWKNNMRGRAQMRKPWHYLSDKACYNNRNRLHLHLEWDSWEAVTTNEVINQLLHHVGAMCIHQLNLLANSNNLPITTFLGKQHPIETHHLSSICDIMEKAMVNGDKCIIRCILVVFQELQTSILNLATQILTGCDEVLEMLQRVTTALINSDIPDKDFRMKGLEQITKSTMLGHLLPVLLTSLMHPNLQTLIMADALMPQLVQLVLYTSQTALLLKTQCTALADVGNSPSGILEQKTKVSPDDRMLEEKEEPGFLTGLKIPAPWAAGKTVETAHPVRDNYKFKESVHIPGARCLYLRFDSRCSSQYDYDKSVAELEQKWQNEVEDALNGKLENNAPFFYDYHYNESKMKELELLCSMKEILFDGSDPENMVLALRIEELTCGGMVEQVQEAFGETMTSVVSLCARYPMACANSIGLLCTIPYT
ncbi:hypothetical protein AB205_0051630, partial [Aquarana catesbeiana]